MIALFASSSRAFQQMAHPSYGVIMVRQCLFLVIYITSYLYELCLFLSLCVKNNAAVIANRLTTAQLTVRLTSQSNTYQV